MESELSSAVRKLEKQQMERKKQLRYKTEREKRMKADALRKIQEVEEQRIRKRLEIAELEEATRLHEQALFEAGGGVKLCVILKPVQSQSLDGKITLPPGILEELDLQNATGLGPMFFEMAQSNGKDTRGPFEDENVKKITAGVREFTAADGTIGIPTHVARNLLLSFAPDDHVLLRYVRLPKGTYAKLQPVGSSFADVHNQKAVLETRLRNHTTLNVGEEFDLTHAGTEFKFRVLELKPASAVSLIDTDIEVDIDLGGTGGSETAIVPLKMGKTTEGRVEKGEFRHYRFEIDDILAGSVTAGETDAVVTLRVKEGTGRGEGSRVVSGINPESCDADVYVSFQPITFPNQHNHLYSCHDSQQEKVVVISGEGFPGPGTYFVGIYGFSGTADFSLGVEIQARDSARSVGKVLPSAQKETFAGNGEQKEGFSKCSNCRQLVPERTFTLHEAFCLRNNFACPFPACGAVLRREEREQHVHCLKCGVPLEKGTLQKHDTVFHTPVPCDCGKLLEMEEMRKHRSLDCPFRLITCQFCSDLVPAEGISEDLRDKIQGLSLHESRCGSRTAPCDDCQRHIPLKDMELHRKAAHGLSTAPLVTIRQPQFPPQTYEPESGRVSSREDIKCPICFKRFPGTFLLEKHVEDHFGGAEDAPGSREGREVAQNLPGELLPPPHMNKPNFRATNDVECPICGTFVHSERDLSVHIDVEHVM